MNIAIIENDVVVNVIVAVDLPSVQNLFPNVELLEIDEINSIGMNWDRKSGDWRPPKPEYDCVWNNEYKAWFTEQELAFLEQDTNTPLT